MRRHTLILTLALVLLLAACGGDDGDSGGALVGPGGDAGDVADEAEADGGSGDEAAPETGLLGGGSEGFSSEECQELFTGLASAASAFGGGPEDGDLTDVADYFRRISEEVPEEVRADFQLFADAYGKFAEAADEAGIDFSNPETMSPENLEQLSEAAQAFEDPEVQAASERISTFAEERCGLAE